MLKLLIISGPTASGKTALAVKLAQKYNGELISADSRQIYKGMDIGTGKDHPKGIPLHLIDLITPKETFSVAHYRRLALKKIADLHSRGRLPILVGCTGFYIDSVVSPSYDTFSIKPSFLLRAILNRFPVSVLQFILKLISPVAYSKLNNSDLHNPLRLIRKIEIKLYFGNTMPPALSREGLGEGLDYLHLSLTAPNQFLYDRIDKRVEDRLRLGHLDELKNLLKLYCWSDPGLKVSAYQCFKDYFTMKISLAACIQKWKFREHRDARRQKTWFKKRPEAKLVDITNKNYLEDTLTLVDKWYNEL